MTEASTPESSSQLKANVLRRESLCDEFEQAMLEQKQPSLDSYLQKVDPDVRPALFRELLLIELHYLDQRSCEPDFATYQARFPQFQSALDELSANKQLWQCGRDESACTSIRVEGKSHSTPSGRSRIRVRCPHCNEAMEVATDAPLTGVVCELCGSQFSLADDELDRPPESLASIAHYELRSRIGVGGFGSVWRAVDTKLDRIVAVKIPRGGQLDRKQEFQLINEARAAAQLNHPNIVAVHEVGRCDNTIYIVSDLVVGETLSDWIEKHHPTRSECVDVCIKIADALHHAHESGVVHRDMKASNVLIEHGGEPKVTDFGLAKRQSVETTIGEDGKIFGTPAYMSPEQARGEGHHADRRTDVYSLGVVLFQMLTDELPFRGNAGALLFEVLHNDPPSPRSMNESIPRDLETICLKCLEKDTAKRYQTAKDLADELRRFQLGEPILSRPISRAERAWRWCRRHPMSATAAGLLTIIAVASPIIAIRERFHFLEASKFNTDNRRLIQQLTVDRDELSRKLNAESESRPFNAQVRITPARRQFIKIAYDQYQPAIDYMLSAATPEDRCLTLLGLAILAKEVLPTDEAIQALLKARDELEAAVKTSDDNPQLSAALASCYDFLGDLYETSDQPKSARVYRERAEKVWSQLVESEPTLATYDALAENQFYISGLEGEAGDSESAFSRVGEKSRRPASERLGELFPRSAKQLYETACALANCRPWLTQNPQEAADKTAPVK